MSNKPIFFPQAFLVWKQMYDMGQKSLSKSELKKGEYASVAKLEGDYQPEAVVSKLFGKVDLKASALENMFLNLDNSQISALVPEIRLYKITSFGDVRKTQPFYFPVGAEYSLNAEGNLDLNKSFSGGGAVIESFTYTLEGKNPYDVTRKFLSAELKIKVDNMSVIFDRKPGFALLADLFTISAGNRNEAIAGSAAAVPGSRLGDLQSCRIAATLGYQAPRDYRMFTQEQITFIEQSKMLLNLYFPIYSLSL